MADIKNSKYLGKWRNASVTVFGKTEPMSDNSYIEIRADGTASYISKSETRDYTWKETNYGVFLDGKSDLKLKEDDDTLHISFLGITINYERME